MRRRLLVDGHSVIFSWPDLRALHQRQPRQGRESLVHQLRELHDQGGWEVTVVFDGKAGPASAPASREGDLIVTYSRQNQTADSVIEGLVAGQSKGESVTVVTADQAERITVEALGGLCLSPDWLREEMRSVRQDFQEDLRRHQRRQKG